MKRIFFVILLLSICFYGYSQKMLVTDFVFFNSYTDENTSEIPNYFDLSSQALEQTKAFVSENVGNEYEISSTDFDTDAISFTASNNKQNPTKSYKEKHKALIKKGGYDYYLLVLTYIEDRSKGGYEFKLEVKLSNEKGKKVIGNEVKLPFEMLHDANEISNSILISSEDFFEVFNSAFKLSLSNEKPDSDPVSFDRLKDAQFDGFIAESERYEIEKMMAANPVIKGENNEVEIGVVGAIDTSKEISDGGQVLAGGLSGLSMSIRNPLLGNVWNVDLKPREYVTADIAVAPSGDLIIKPSDGTPFAVKMINGRLAGRINDEAFVVNYDPASRLTKIYKADGLIALIQPIGNNKSDLRKLYYQGPAETFGLWVNFHQLYHHALYALSEVQKVN